MRLELSNDILWFCDLRPSDRNLANWKCENRRPSRMYARCEKRKVGGSTQAGSHARTGWTGTWNTGTWDLQFVILRIEIRRTDPLRAHLRARPCFQGYIDVPWPKNVSDFLGTQYGEVWLTVSHCFTQTSMIIVFSFERATAEGVPRSAYDWSQSRDAPIDKPEFSASSNRRKKQQS